MTTLQLLILTAIGSLFIWSKLAEIEFWATVKVKMVNGEVQLQALVDGKKIIVTKASVRRDLQLNDDEGKSFLRKRNTVYSTMMVQAQEEMGKGSAIPTDPRYTPTIIQPSTSQP
ncbi:hypothetical protein Tco_0794693 [Tanacetum coccineum]